MNLSLTLLLALAGSAAAYADRPVHVVAIRDFTYKPADLTIQAGESVRFENGDDVAHTVSANDASFDSGSLDTGKSWTYVFPSAGTYAYFCAVHPSMQGKIVVTPST